MSGSRRTLHRRRRHPGDLEVAGDVAGKEIRGRLDNRRWLITPEGVSILASACPSSNIWTRIGTPIFPAVCARTATVEALLVEAD
jgi:hypothetical protein